MQEIKKVEINGISHNGKGVGRIDGKVVFVGGALPGEVVDVEITKKKKNFFEAIVKNILQKSDDRISENCLHYNQCGGCNLRHTSYTYEVELKTRIVRETLKKIANIDEKIISNCIPSLVFENYRNKMQYHVSNINGKPRLGFIGQDYKFFEKTDCVLGDISITGWANVIEENLPNGVTRVIIRKAYPNDDLLCLLVAPEKLQLKETAINAIMAYPQAKSLFLNISSSLAPDILGEETYKVYGEEYLIEEINDIKYAVGPTSFFQVNPYQTSTLFETAINFVPDKKHQKLLDLFCGVGSITLFAAKKAKTIFGVEISEEAIRYAKFNARLNSIDNAEFLAADVANIESSLEDNYDCIIIDPPRKGCSEQTLDLISKRTNYIVYVSCESSTLARDLKFLQSFGFKAEKVIPVDMFPRTAHVETVCLMTNSGLKGK